MEERAAETDAEAVSGPNTKTRAEAAEQRRLEIELERQRLEHEETLERLRQQQEREQERERREAERELAIFRQNWQDKAAEAVTVYQYRWLSAVQRKEVLEGLEAEIARRQPADEPRMPAVVIRTLEALVEPLKAEREAQEARQKLTEEALRGLPYSTTEAEKMRARTAIEDALRPFDRFADVCKMRVVVAEAVRPVRHAIERRLLDERLITWALGQLPWSRTEFDIARVRRECAEILPDLPADVSEPEGKAALEPTVREVFQEIEQRRVEEPRRARKASLVQQGVAEVSSYLLELKGEGEILEQEYRDRDFWAELVGAVRRRLDTDLTGGERATVVHNSVRDIIDRALE